MTIEKITNGKKEMYHTVTL